MEVDQAGHGQRHADEEQGADPQRPQDGDRHVALGPPRLLGGGGHGVEAQEGEQHDAGRLQDPADAIGAGSIGPDHPLRHEREPVAAVGVGQAEHREQDDGGDLDQHNGGVEARRLLGAHKQQPGHHQHHRHRRQVHQGAGGNQSLRLQGQRRDGQSRRQLQPDARHHVLHVARPADRHRAAGEQHLGHQGPTDHPADRLAEGVAGEAVGRARHRQHRRQLGVAQRREGADHRPDQEAHRHRRPGIDRRGMPGQDEDPGPNDSPDPEQGQADRAERAGQIRAWFRLVCRHGPPAVQAPLRTSEDGATSVHGWRGYAIAARALSGASRR